MRNVKDKYVTIQERRESVEQCVEDHAKDLRSRGIEVREEKLRKEWGKIAQKTDRDRGWG